MATQTKQTSAFTPDFDAAFEQLRENGDKFVGVSRKASSAYLDGVEKYAGHVADFQRKIGEQVKVEPFAGVFAAQAKLTEDLTSAGIAAARDLIAA
jgi:hypothetical protein